MQMRGEKTATEWQLPEYEDDRGNFMIDDRYCGNPPSILNWSRGLMNIERGIHIPEQNTQFRVIVARPSYSSPYLIRDHNYSA